MKKLIVFLLTLVLLMAFAGEALADTQRINLTYSRVINKDIDINDYKISGSTRDKEISLEGALVDYLAENDLVIQITFTNSSQKIAISGKALQTAEYLTAKKSGENISVVIKVFTSGDSLVTKYFARDAMNYKGLYSANETAIMLQAKMLRNGRFYLDYSSFAAPITITSPYTWGQGAFATPGRMTADKLRYYYIEQPDKNPGFDGYRWEYAGGGVDLSSKEIFIDATHVGFYCALASATHGGDAADEGEQTPSPTGFKDISGHWSEGSVEYLKSINTIRNEGDYFYPNRDITRAEYAFYLVRVLSLNEDLSGAAGFKDLDSAKYYYKEAATAASTGLIRGKADGIFAPDEKITRQEMAAMITRALGMKNKGITPNPDSIKAVGDYGKISPWALDSCQTVYEIGLMRGVTGNLFAPLQYTTRGEAAAILSRLHTYLY